MCSRPRSTTSCSAVWRSRSEHGAADGERPTSGCSSDSRAMEGRRTSFPVRICRAPSAGSRRSSPWCSIPQMSIRFSPSSTRRARRRQCSGSRSNSLRSPTAVSASECCGSSIPRWASGWGPGAVHRSGSTTSVSLPAEMLPMRTRRGILHRNCRVSTRTRHRVRASTRRPISTSQRYPKATGGLSEAISLMRPVSCPRTRSTNSSSCGFRH